MITFDPETGEYLFMDSATSDYYFGLYDSETGYTYFQWYDYYSPTSGEYYLLHRFDTFFHVDRPQIQEIDFETTSFRYMTCEDVEDVAKVSKLRYPEPVSSSTFDSPNRPKYANYSHGKFKKPISPRQMATRVKDDVTTNAFGIYEISGLYRHIMSSGTFLFNIDTEYYHMPDSPMAFSQYANYCAVDVESYTEYYCWTVQVVSTNTIGNTCTFQITGTVTPPLQSSYPLGKQLQASIPNEAIHHGIACNGCNKPSIAGVRFQCCECENFNLCSKCEDAQVARSGHSAQHQLLKIKVPIAPRTIHTGITCNKCEVSPIEGVRYKCQTCDDFDLCEKCERTTDHPINHPLIKAKQQLK